MNIFLRAAAWCLAVSGSLLTANAAPRYLVKSWQSEDGLPSNSVRAVVQAPDGYLWVGTAEGVVRFDGVRFTGFPKEPDATLSRLPTRAIFPLANGELWVTANSGQLLRGRGTRLDEIAVPATSEASAEPISLVALDAGGDVIIQCGKGLWRARQDEPPRLTEHTPAVDALLREAEAKNREQGRPAFGETTKQLRDRRGRIWRFAPDEGLTLTDAEGRSESPLLPAELPSGINEMLEDREGNIWLATSTQGLWRLRLSRVEVLTLGRPGDQAVRLVFEDKEGALWIAPRAGGVDRLVAGSAKHFEVGPESAQRPVSALCESAKGGTWATRDDTIHRFQNGDFMRAFPVGKGISKVSAMTEDGLGRVWLGSPAGIGNPTGVSVWDGGDMRPMDTGGPQNVTSLASDGPAVWLGTESGRLFHSEGERLKPVASHDAFGHRPISGLLPDADGSVWVGTMGGGLYHVGKNNRVTGFLPRMGQVDARITSVLADDAGFLWLGTLGGICRVPKAELTGGNSNKRVSALVLDRGDGLLNRECTRGGQPAGWRGRDGTLWFATVQGVAHVDPKQIPVNREPPPVVIELALANGHPLANGGKVGPGRSRLEFRYTALSFSTPDKVRFRTRLEGLDEAWNEVGRQRAVAYEAVPPGNYRFRVLAENGDGVWNETGAVVAIEVVPHLWEARWFQTCAALATVALALGVGALVMRARLRGRLLRLEAKSAREAERARIAQDLHDDLGASLTEISLLANLAAEERQQDGCDDTLLPEIATTAQSLVGALDEIVWAANPKHDTLRSLAEYLTSFAGKFLSRAGITLRRDVPRDLPEISLDAERRHSAFLAVREALNNAVKHSGASEIWLRFRLEGPWLKIAVEDNGCGFDPDVRAEGDGVGNLTSRLARVGGECRITSRPGGGTSILLSLPLD